MVHCDPWTLSENKQEKEIIELVILCQKNLG